MTVPRRTIAADHGLRLGLLSISGIKHLLGPSAPSRPCLNSGRRSTLSPLYRFDPVWFGVMSMLMVAMGLVFPPVGMIAFVVSSSANVSLMKVHTGTSILMIALVLTTALVMIFPHITLWLPSTMR